MTRLFKARHLPNDFIGSRLGNNPNYVWRSIFNAKMVVKQGARWSIGTSAARCSRAPWLKDGLFLTTDNYIYALLSHVNVKDIIDHSTKVGNALLIYNLFDQNTTQLILNTPLQPLVNEDKLIWKTEKNGNYSVCSACILCVIEIVDNSHLHIPSR